MRPSGVSYQEERALESNPPTSRRGPSEDAPPRAREEEAVAGAVRAAKPARAGEAGEAATPPRLAIPQDAGAKVVGGVAGAGRPRAASRGHPDPRPVELAPRAGLRPQPTQDVAPEHRGVRARSRHVDAGDVLRRRPEELDRRRGALRRRSVGRSGEDERERREHQRAAHTSGPAPAIRPSSSEATLAKFSWNIRASSRAFTS